MLDSVKIWNDRMIDFDWWAKWWEEAKYSRISQTVRLPLSLQLEATWIDFVNWLFFVTWFWILLLFNLFSCLLLGTFVPFTYQIVRLAKLVPKIQYTWKLEWIEVVITFVLLHKTPSDVNTTGTQLIVRGTDHFYSMFVGQYVWHHMTGTQSTICGTDHIC